MEILNNIGLLLTAFSFLISTGVISWIFKVSKLVDGQEIEAKRIAHQIEHSYLKTKEIKTAFEQQLKVLDSELKNIEKVSTQKIAHLSEELKILKSNIDYRDRDIESKFQVEYRKIDKTLAEISSSIALLSQSLQSLQSLLKGEQRKN